MLRLASNHEKLKRKKVFFPGCITGSAILSTPAVGLQPPGLGEKTFLLIESSFRGILSWQPWDLIQTQGSCPREGQCQVPPLTWVAGAQRQTLSKCHSCDFLDFFLIKTAACRGGQQERKGLKVLRDSVALT